MSGKKMMPIIKLAALYIVSIAVFFAFSKFMIFAGKEDKLIFWDLRLVWDLGTVLTVLRIVLILLFIVFYVKIVRSMELKWSHFFYIICGVLTLSIVIANNHFGVWIWGGVDVQAVQKTAVMLAMTATIQIFLGILMKMNIRLAV